jgi:hypothetical protein
MRTRSIEEVRETLARIYAKPVLTPARGAKLLDATMNYCPMNDLRLYYRRYGAAVWLEFPETEYLLQVVPLRGKGELIIGGVGTALMPGTTVIVPANTGWMLQCSADYEHLAVRIDAEALADKLVSMTGASIEEPLRMQPRQGPESPTARFLPQYINSLVNTVSSADSVSTFPAWWLKQTEQLLMAMLLCCNHHNYSHLLDEKVPDVTAMEVRRVEDYIEAHWHEPITLQDLAAVAGVSEFGLFYSFRQYRNYSPLEFLARIRLQQRESPA